MLEGDELAAAYASADVMVFPSTTDTVGDVVLEAQASGVPVIVSDLGGPAEIGRRYGSGIMVDLQQPQALVDAMEKLYLSPELRADLRAQGLRNASQFTWDVALESLWSLDAGAGSDALAFRSASHRLAPGTIALGVA